MAIKTNSRGVLSWASFISSFRIGVVKLILVLCLPPGLALAESLLGQTDRPLQYVDLAYFGDKDDKVLNGLKYALDEMNWQGKLLGYEFRLKAYAPREIIAIRNPMPVAIFAATDAESLRLMSQLNPDAAIFNITESLDDLRALCLENLFHIIPSARMREDAIAQWQDKFPDTKPVAMAWHANIKDDAREFNKKFQREYGQQMDEYSWSAWTAMKIFNMSFHAVKPADPDKLIEYLRDELIFDGYKDIEMSFRANGQLRQMLFLVEESEVLGSVPAIIDGIPGDLDSLGFTHCPGALDM